jgi:hypothetical protein
MKCGRFLFVMVAVCVPMAQARLSINTTMPSQPNRITMITWGYDSSIVADITVSGSGTEGGSLHFTGFFNGPGPVSNFSVTGTLGGKQVAVLVPSA